MQSPLIVESVAAPSAWNPTPLQYQSEQGNVKAGEANLSWIKELALVEGPGPIFPQALEDATVAVEAGSVDPP